MKGFSQRQGLGIYAAVALLTGCGGGSQLGANPIQQSPARTVGHLDHSWVAPEAEKSDLVYISNFYGSDILAFTYPRGTYVGSISGVTDAQGLCAAKTGNWWAVASGTDQVLEFAHGGTTPLKTLTVTAGEPAGCTVDPTTGNLAVTILGAADIEVFTGASGSGTILADGLTSTYFAGYDDNDDLFVDGINPSDAYGVVELPKGSSTFVPFTLNRRLEFPGGIQWHRNYLAIGDGEAGVIYHFAVHGTKGKEIGLTHFNGGGFWIQGRHVAAADAGNEDAAICKYPAGNPCKTLQGNFDLPIGVTVSVAK
jgi:hypothetical protein